MYVSLLYIYEKSQKYMYLKTYGVINYNGMNKYDGVNRDKNTYLTIGLIIFIFYKYTIKCRQNKIFQLIISYFYSGTYVLHVYILHYILSITVHKIYQFKFHSCS